MTISFGPGQGRAANPASKGDAPVHEPTSVAPDGGLSLTDKKSDLGGARFNDGGPELWEGQRQRLAESYRATRGTEKPDPGSDPHEPWRPRSEVGDRSLGRTHSALAFAVASAGAFGVAAVGGHGIVALGAAVAGFYGAMRTMLAFTPDRVRRTNEDSLFSNEYSNGAGYIAMPMTLMIAAGYQNFSKIGIPILGLQIAIGAGCAVLHFIRPTPTRSQLEKGSKDSDAHE